MHSEHPKKEKERKKENEVSIPSVGLVFFSFEMHQHSTNLHNYEMLIVEVSLWRLRSYFFVLSRKSLCVRKGSTEKCPFLCRDMNRRGRLASPASTKSVSFNSNWRQRRPYYVGRSGLAVDCLPVFLLSGDYTDKLFRLADLKCHRLRRRVTDSFLSVTNPRNTPTWYQPSFFSANPNSFHYMRGSSYWAKLVQYLNSDPVFFFFIFIVLNEKRQLSIITEHSMSTLETKSRRFTSTERGSRCVEQTMNFRTNLNARRLSVALNSLSFVRDE